MAKFSSRLRPEEQFETLRDFGFGTPTGAEFPAESRGHPGAAGSLAADVHPGQHGHGLRVRGDAGAARGGVRGHRERRHPARAHAGARGARTRRASCSTGTSPSRCGGWSPPRSRPSCGSSCARRWGKAAPARWRSWPTTRCSGRPAPRVRFQNGHYVRGEYTASFAAIFPADHPQLVVIVKIDNPRGQLLRRPHGRAGDAHDAAAGARLAPGGDRPRPPRRARHRGPEATKPLAAAPAGPPPVVVTLPYRAPEISSAGAAGAGRCRALDPRGGARAAPAGVPGEPARARAGGADRARGGRERAAGSAVLVLAQ